MPPCLSEPRSFERLRVSRRSMVSVRPRAGRVAWDLNEAEGVSAFGLASVRDKIGRVP